jgi:hypothetical protein
LSLAVISTAVIILVLNCLGIEVLLDDDIAMFTKQGTSSTIELDLGLCRNHEGSISNPDYFVFETHLVTTGRLEHPFPVTVPDLGDRAGTWPLKLGDLGRIRTRIYNSITDNWIEARTGY